MSTNTNDGDTLNHFNNVRDARVKEIQKIKAPKTGETVYVKSPISNIKITKKMGGPTKKC
jgi:hypothetical protein